MGMITVIIVSVVLEVFLNTNVVVSFKFRIVIILLPFSPWKYLFFSELEPGDDDKTELFS